MRLGERETDQADTRTHKGRERWREVGRARREGHPRTKRATEAEKTGATEGGGKVMRRATVKRGQIPHEKKSNGRER